MMLGVEVNMFSRKNSTIQGATHPSRHGVLSTGNSAGDQAGNFMNILWVFNTRRICHIFLIKMWSLYEKYLCI